MPAWATFDAASGQLTGTPKSTDVGTYRSIVIWVTDGGTPTQLPSFDRTVNAGATANRAPAIAGAPKASIVAGNPYTFTPTATDADGNALAFSITNRPSWASFNTATGTLSGTPQVANAGPFANTVITGSDGQMTASLPAFSVVVTAAATNSPPVISGAPVT